MLGTKLEDLLMNHDVSFDAKDHIESIDGAMFWSMSLELSVKEILLKILADELLNDQEVIMKALTSHIYKSYCIYCKLGHPGAAKVSLSSLRYLMKAFQKE